MLVGTEETGIHSLSESDCVNCQPSFRMTVSAVLLLDVAILLALRSEDALLELVFMALLKYTIYCSLRREGLYQQHWRGSFSIVAVRTPQ